MLCLMCFSPLSHLSNLENFLLQFESESLISECRQFWFHLKTLHWLVFTLPHDLSRLSFSTAHLMIALIIASLKIVPLHSARGGHSSSCHMNKRSHTGDTVFMPVVSRSEFSIPAISHLCLRWSLFQRTHIWNLCQHKL